MQKAEIQPTSIEAWNDIRGEQWFKKGLGQVCAFIAEMGGATIYDIGRGLKMPSNYISRYLLDAEKMGVLVRGEITMNPTGHKAIKWCINPFVSKANLRPRIKEIKPAPVLKRIRSKQQFDYALQNGETLLLRLPNGELRQTDTAAEWEYAQHFELYRVRIV